MLGSNGGGGSCPNRHGAGVLSGYRGELDRYGEQGCWEDKKSVCAV